MLGFVSGCLFLMFVFGPILIVSGGLGWGQWAPFWGAKRADEGAPDVPEAPIWPFPSPQDSDYARFEASGRFRGRFWEYLFGCSFLVGF